MRTLFAFIAIAFAATLTVRVSGQPFAPGDQDELTSVAELIPDEDLVDVSPFAALIEATQRYRTATTCSTAGFFSSLEDGESKRPGNPLLVQLSGDAEGECRFYRLAWQEISQVFEAIKRDRALPQAPYVFSVFVPSPPDEGGNYTGGYLEETMGLFSGRESCERLEREAHRSNLPTRQCVEWTEPRLN